MTDTVAFLSSGAMVYSSMIKLSCEFQLVVFHTRIEDPMVTPASWVQFLFEIMNAIVEAQVYLESLKI